MKTAQMAASLRQLAPLLEQIAGVVQARLLVRTADALEQAGEIKLRTLDAKLKKSLGQGAANPAVEFVAKMSGTFAAAGCASPSKDFTVLASILQRLSGLDAEGAVRAINAALAPPPPKISRLPKSPSIDVRQVADRLTAASGANDAFDAMFVEVEKLSKSDLEQVAERYLGYHRKYKSKPEVLKAIRARQFQDAIEDGRNRRISKIAV
jgi:hypothetical protein